MTRRSASASTSHQRRTVVLAVGALLAGVPLLASCGTPHAGAAAVVGDEQITVSTLQDKVNAVRAAQNKLENADQVRERSGNLQKVTLYSMVLDRVVSRAAKDEGVSVSRSELQKFRHNQEAVYGGAETLRVMLLQQQGVAPSQIDDFLRTELTVQTIARQRGVDLRTAQGREQVGAILEKASKELDVDVNPRYGTWDSKKLTITTTSDGWLHKPKKEQA